MGNRLSWPAWPAAAAGLALAGMAGMAETAAVIQGATPGLAYSPSAVFGLGQLTSPGTLPTGVLSAWAAVASAYPLRDWLIVYLVFDLAFMAGYLLLGIAALRVLDQWHTASSAGRADRSGAAGRVLLKVAFLVNLVQVLFGLAYAFSIGSTYGESPVFANGLHWLGALKWLSAILLLGWFCYQWWDHRSRMKALARAVKTQRFSLLFTALLAVIAIVPGPNALQQMPDVQRAWLSGPASVAWSAVLPAIAAQILVALIIFHVGRMRLRRAAQPQARGTVKAAEVGHAGPGQRAGQHDRAANGQGVVAAQETAPAGEATYEQSPADRKDRAYLGWLATPVAVLALAGLLDLFGWARVSWAQLAIAVLVVMWGVALASFIYETTLRARALREAGCHATKIRLALTAAQMTLREIGTAILGELHYRPKKFAAEIQRALEEKGDRAERVRRVRVVGELLAVAVIVIAGLGLLRSFITPALMAGGTDAIGAWLAVGVGMIVAVLALPIMRLILKPLRRTLATGQPEPSSDVRQILGLSRAAAVVVAAILAAADVWLIFFPLSAADRLGVVATTVIVWGTLALGLAWLAHLAQNREPLPLFALFRLKSTPVISVVVAFAALSLTLGQSSQLHQVDGHPGSVSRHSITWALGNWLRQVPDSPCLVSEPQPSTGPDVQVEPLVLVAAAGGGIRAAWWTAGALGTIADSGCGRRAVFAVSGVSGGSLGSAVVATARAGKGWSVRRQVKRILIKIARPTALASAIDGLVLRDNIAALTGINFTAVGKAAGLRYPDRAALLEQAWETADPALLTSFTAGSRTATVGGGRHRDWQLLFNTTAVRSNCRAVIATSTLGPATGPADGTPGCLSVSPMTAEPALPDSYDLLTALPCLSHIDVATAVMLSARFAYITPSGVVQGCHVGAHGVAPSGTQVEQYIDGGYIDSSGLATLNDVAASLMAAVARYNADAVAHQRPGVPIRLVVPVVAFLPNTPIPRPNPTLHVLSPAWEPLLPLPRQFLNSPKAQFASQAVLMQQLAARITSSQWLPCPPRDSNCAAARQAAERAVPVNLVIVAPQQQPGLFSVPLGWVLSQASQADLNTAIAQDATHPCGTQGSVYCPAGTAGLQYLLRLIGSHP